MEVDVVCGLLYFKAFDLYRTPSKWIDRPIDWAHLEKLVKILNDNPAAMTNGQSWLGIANIAKEEIKYPEDIKSCHITVIGGLHRMKAYEKASSFSNEHEKLLTRVGITMYDNGLTDS